MRHILLKELTAQEKSAHVFKANHESLEDTYKDAGNYALTCCCCSANGGDNGAMVPPYGGRFADQAAAPFI